MWRWRSISNCSIPDAGYFPVIIARWLFPCGYANIRLTQHRTELIALTGMIPNAGANIKGRKQKAAHLLSLTLRFMLSNDCLPLARRLLAGCQPEILAVCDKTLVFQNLDDLSSFPAANLEPPFQE